MMKKQERMKGKLSRFARDERGVQLVELAIVLPIFLMTDAKFTMPGSTLNEPVVLGLGTLAVARAAFGVLVYAAAARSRV